MIIRLTNLMNEEEAGKIVSALSAESHAIEGKPMLASDTSRRMGAAMRTEILKIEAFSLAAMPRRMTDFEIHRMDEGMSYAIPIDQPVVGATGDNPVRTDLRMTLFLSQPVDYGGGELSVNVSTGNQKLKMAVGDAAIYPANEYHFVEEVIRGARWTAEATIQSIIREEEQRTALTELWTVMNWMEGVPQETAEQLRPSYQALKRAHSSLHRYWADV